MKDNVAIQLKYTGNDVEDGTMSVEDMIPALQGFSSAYGKIVNSDEIQVRHKLRVIGIEHGSFDILLQVFADAVNVAQENKELFAIGGTFGYLAINKIIGVIKISKHVKNQPYDTKINGNKGTVNIVNIDKLSIEMPYETFVLFDEKTLKQDINKIVKPLEEGRIDSTEIIVEGEGGKISESVSIDEKKYFDVERVEITKTEIVELVGVLNSLTKTTNNGFFILNNGDRIPYHLAVKNPEELYPHFIHKGVVRIKCKAYLDENLKPTQLDVLEIIPLQRSIFPDKYNKK